MIPAPNVNTRELMSKPHLRPLVPKKSQRVGLHDRCNLDECEQDIAREVCPEGAEKGATLVETDDVYDAGEARS